MLNQESVVELSVSLETLTHVMIRSGTQDNHKAAREGRSLKSLGEK